MDPLSISFGIAGVLPLIAKVITTAHQYATSVAGAQKMISALILELEVLQAAIAKLEHLLTSADLADADLKFDQTSVLLSCCAAIETKLQELLRKLLRDAATGKMGRLLWPLTEKEHQKTLGELRSFSAWIQFALSVDGCRLLAQTSGDVAAVLAQQLKQFDALRRLDTRTEELVGAVQRQAQVLEDGAKLEARKRVLDWISTAKYNARHALLQRSRTKNTGSWLLDSKAFMEWRDGTAGSRVLWCNGIQGSGKTTLVCTAIDELLRSSVSPAKPLAYLYFDYQDHSSQGPLAVVTSILRQLLEQLPDLPTPVQEYYEGRDKLQGREIAEYERLLEEVARASETMFIVFDALDECDDIQYVLLLIEKLGQISNCRLMIASRPHVYERVPASRGYSTITVEAHDEDIRRYVLERSNEADIYQIADEKFVEQLVEKLTRSASGMFLLPVLQLRTVLNEPTIGEMEDKLEQLSDTLSDAFAETFARIQRQPGSRSRLAVSALMHLAHAKRLFKAVELSDILALKPESKLLNPKYRPTAKMILDCCQGLAMLDEQAGQIRLAHYAIKEYLVSNSELLFPQFEVKLAFDCLNYMMLDDFGAGPLYTKGAIKERLAAYPFLGYVAANWGRYLKPIEMNPEVWNKLLSFYTTLPATATATQVKYFLKGYHRGYYCVEECISTTPLHHAALNCLEHSIRGLLEYFDINRPTVMGTTPVIKAASNGHRDIVKLLLEKGADPRIRNWYGDALQCAAEAGKCETIRILVEWGMDPNGEDNCGRPPISCALDRDSPKAVELLVDLGANLRLDEDEQYGNAFLLACHLNRQKTVDMMLRRGWVHLQSARQDITMLALCTAPAPMVRHLVDAGADVNAVDGSGRTALWYAMEEGEIEIIEILQSKNATLPEHAHSMDIDDPLRQFSTATGAAEASLGEQYSFSHGLPFRPRQDIQMESSTEIKHDAQHTAASVEEATGDSSEAWTANWPHHMAKMLSPT
ncbi:hypothetical protein NLG97_g8460 [Lecanicillium saksenae]|uniref:Uncharacterized protein n=1 Tax=Lecanicillium saksenae TaxID=468837 RepID=A0ACC1QKL2_9HYPO|nr:hypothetical protein NLG97_g8460 [Lecanicillium saksenae]